MGIRLTRIATSSAHSRQTEWMLAPPEWRTTRFSELSLILTLAAAVLGTVSLTGAEPRIGYLGVLHSLPRTLFIAVVLLTVAALLLWFSSQGNERLSFCQSLLLNGAFWLAPLTFGDWLPGGYHTYEFFGFTEYILRSGHVSPDMGSLWYHSWPGFFTEIAVLMRVLEVANPDMIIRLAPFGVQILYQCGLYLFFRNTLGGRYCWIGLWLFALGNWQQQNALLPQGYALALFLMILGLLTKRRSGVMDNLASGRHRLIIFLLFIGIVISHALTALVTLSMMGGLYLFRERSLKTFIVLAFVAAISWMLFGGAPFFEASLPLYAALLPQLVEKLMAGFFEVLLQPTSAGSGTHQLVVALRLLLMALIFGISLAGTVVSLRSRKDRGTDLAVLAMGVGISGLVLMTGLLSAGVFNRVYTFGLPLAVYFGAKTLGNKEVRWVVAVCLLLAGPLHFVSQEGNQIIDYIPRGYVKGLKFFHDHTSGGTVTEVRGLEGDPPPFGGFKHRESYVVERYRWPQWKGVLEAISSGRMGRPPSYVVTSDILDQPVTEYLSGDPSIAGRIKTVLENSPNSRVYANGAVTITLLNLQ